MTTFKNDEVFRVAGDEEVTVSITFLDNPDNDDFLVLRNAIEALRFFANSSGTHKSWSKKIEVDR